MEIFRQIGQFVGTGIAAIALAVSSFLHPVPAVIGPPAVTSPEIEAVQAQIAELQTKLYRDQIVFGATIPKVVAVFETRIVSQITPIATSITLANGTTTSGNTLSGYIGFVIDEGNSNEEFVACTAAGPVLTSCLRGIDPIDGDLEVTALKKQHRAGASVKITDHPVLAVMARILNGDETIPNILSYDGAITSSTFSSAQQLVSKAYADQLTFAGAPNASLTQKGLVQIPTKGELQVGTSAGSTGALLAIPNSYASPTSTATTTVILSKTNGKLSQGFLDLTENFAFTGTVTAPTLVPVGTVVAYVTTTAPSGWLVADGSAVSRSTYAALFAVVSTTFGAGDGTTTFNVPNMKSRVARGYNTASTSVDNIGETGGSETHTLLEAELAPHTHTVSAYTNANANGSTSPPPKANAPGSLDSSAYNTGSTGSGTPFDILNPYITLQYIIKY